MMDLGSGFPGSPAFHTLCIPLDPGMGQHRHACQRSGEFVKDERHNENDVSHSVCDQFKYFRSHG